MRSIGNCALLIVFLLAGVFPGVSCGYEDMACRSDEGRRCLARERGDSNATILCEPLRDSGGDRRTHDCSLAVRDWAKPSPYAHTSILWNCVSGVTNLRLFDRDFADDGVRCHILCGRCEGGWKAIVLPPSP